MSRAAAAALALGVALLPARAGAESMRCPGGIARRGDTDEEVLRKCGEPAYRTSHQRELKAPPAYGAGAVHRIDVETWTYRRGYGKFILHLTFEGGLLVRFDRGPRQE